jgi:hypothetical protein
LWDDLDDAFRFAPLVQGFSAPRISLPSTLSTAFLCMFSRLFYRGARMLFDGLFIPDILGRTRVASRPEMFVSLSGVGIGETRTLLQHLIDQFV